MMERQYPGDSLGGGAWIPEISFFFLLFSLFDHTLVAIWYPLGVKGFLFFFVVAIGGALDQ